MIRKELSKAFLECAHRGSQLSLSILVQGLAVFQLGQQGSVLILQIAVQAMLKRQNLLDFDVVHEALVHCEQRRAHHADGQRAVLLLLEQFGHAGTAVELLAGGFVQVRGELREGGQFAVLRQVGTDTAGQALDQLGLFCS